MTDHIFSLLSMLIESNGAQTYLSEIRVDDEVCYVPRHIYEDSLVEEFSDEIIDETPTHVIYPEKCLDKIQIARRNSYRACVWYPTKIPTAKSILLPIDSINSLKRHLHNYLHLYPIVRLCTLSPKDICVPIFESADLAFLELNRTCDFIDKHLFLREKRKYQWKARCFWSHDKLRAVSLPSSDKSKKILAFFEKWGKEIPYHSAIIDIGETDSGIELIEFNSFGPDMNITAGLFSWKEDAYTLLFSPEPVFRTSMGIII